jgi:two-component system CheB/CheR fusion protein
LVAVPYRHLIARLPTEAARLLRAANELSLARDLPTVTAIVRTAARELTDADGVTFVLRDGGQCFYVDEDAISPLWKGKRFPMSACISGWVMEYGKNVTIPDIYCDDRVPLDAYRPTFVKSLAMVPVRPPDAIAAIGAYWATNHQATDDELGWMALLADSAALALANVQLYDESRAALEREQHAREAAERATAAKDEFLALVAHELRQPLHASMAALRLLTAARSDAQERAAAVVERQIQHMNRIVEDLLDAARIVRGHVILRPELVDVGAAIDQAADSVRAMVAERGHQLSITMPEHPVYVNADAARLQQVLLNLLANAAKYTDSGGHITVTAVNDSRDVNISVRDTGQGIDPAVLPHIFDLFTRGTRNTSGFGVGLTVARRLIELHGGTVEARSAGIGQGSEFVVRLATVVAAV